MRSLVLVAMLARIAAASPASEARFEDCKARRRLLTEQAMTIADADARGRVLASMPTCRRTGDGSFEVSEGEPIPAPETTPFTPHLELTANVGGAYGYIVSNEIQPSGLGPYVELGASYVLGRHLVFGAVGSYSRFRDAMVVDTLRGAEFEVREASYAAIVRASARYSALTFGGGAGIEYAMFAVTGYAQLVPCIEVHGSFTFARTDSVAAQVIAVVTASRGINDGTDQGADLVSMRLAVGLAY